MRQLGSFLALVAVTLFALPAFASPVELVEYSDAAPAAVAAVGVESASVVAVSPLASFLAGPERVCETLLALSPATVVTADMSRPSVDVVALPAVPGTLLLTLLGALCVSLLRDRVTWASLVAALVRLTAAGVLALPRLVAAGVSASWISLDGAARASMPSLRPAGSAFSPQIAFMGLLRRLASRGADSASFVFSFRDCLPTAGSPMACTAVCRSFFPMLEASRRAPALSYCHVRPTIGSGGKEYLVRKTLVLVTALVALCAAPAFAGFASGTLVTESTNGSGTHWLIDQTDVFLFEPTSPYNPAGPGAGLWDQNNMSPVDYPNVNPGYVPSPGSSGDYNLAEHSDLEGLFFHYNCGSGDLDVWLVTSVAPNGFTANGHYYHLGDVFINTDGDSAFEYALLGFGTSPGLAANHTVWSENGHTWSSSNSRSAGALAALDGSSVLYGINGPESWAGSSTVRNLVNPWAVKNPTIVGGGDLIYQEITGADINDRDFADGPSGYPPSGTHSTFVYMWNANIGAGLCIDDLSFHVTVQCGNDDIDGGIPVTPVPGALVLGMVGVAIVGALRRRKLA